MTKWITLLAGLAAMMRAEADWALADAVERIPLSGKALAWERDAVQGERTVRITGVSFDARDCVFRVLDNPPTDRRSLAEALKAAGALAGVNGSYFHPDFRPLGLVVSQGEDLYGFERAKLLSGVLAIRPDDHMELLRAGEFDPKQNLQEALQAGPWLIENGTATSGLENTRRARRTVVAGDGGKHWAIIVISPATLAEAADLLELDGLAGNWNIKNALNLDGGSSSAFLALADGQPTFEISSFGPVRNYLAIVPRQN